jgi:hypothetical protein
MLVLATISYAHDNIMVTSKRYPVYISEFSGNQFIGYIARGAEGEEYGCICRKILHNGEIQYSGIWDAGLCVSHLSFEEIFSKFEDTYTKQSINNYISHESDELLNS